MIVRGSAVAVLVGAGLLLAVAARPARAAPDKLTKSDFAVDLFQGPVIGSTRVIGLGGAYSAVAEGAVGIPFHPASVANRPYHSEGWFDWDIAFDFVWPGLFQDDDFDFDNNGSSTSPDFIVWNVGGLLQFGSLGCGAYARGQTFQVTATEVRPTGPVERTFDIALWTLQLSSGYALFGHQLVLGGGVKGGAFQVSEPGVGGLFETAVVGGEVGALVRPSRWPFRFAAAFSVPLLASTKKQCEAQSLCPSQMVMPDSVGLPWELRVGASYFLGARPYNPPPPLTRRRKERARRSGGRPSASQPAPTSAPSAAPTSAPSAAPTSAPAAAPAPAPTEPDPDRDYRGGWYLLLSAELGVIGALDDAIGTDAYFQQVRERSGERVVLCPRFGAESEVLRRRLRLRAGGYWEPSRFEGRDGRMHGTFAFDLRLFDLSLWGSWSIRFASAVDLAVRYSNLSLSLGLWH